MNLLEQLEEYLTRNNVAPSTFGRHFFGDPRFVFDLRNGARLRSKREEELAFILHWDCPIGEPIDKEQF